MAAASESDVRLEDAFGMIERPAVLRRWGIRRLEVKLSKLPLLVMVICILHNLAIPRDGRELPGLRALRRAAHGAFGRA